MSIFKRGHTPAPFVVGMNRSGTTLLRMMLDAHPELVKTMSVAPPRGEGRVRLLEIPGIDLQACGGTHVANTAEIGALKVVRIRSEGKRNKRVTLELA